MDYNINVERRKKEKEISQKRKKIKKIKGVKKMKIYEMIIDNGENVFKCIRPAETKKALTKMYSGNGEFVRIKEATEEYKINLEKLYDTLKKANYKEEEIDIIVNTLQITNIGE